MTVMNTSSDLVILTSRVLAEPKKMDKGERARHSLARARRHRRRWPKPEDATLILNFHFHTYTPRPNLHYAEATLEIPREGGCDYYSIVRSGKTKNDALLAVIKNFENSEWFHVFKSEGVYFYVSGELEYLYRGYL